MNTRDPYTATPKETAQAIAQRERIRRSYLRDVCPDCKFFNCQCEELTQPNQERE
jgi:hypothetical protein